MVRMSSYKALPILFIFFFIVETSIFSQTGSDTTCSAGLSLFQKLYTGAKDDNGLSIAITADSGYVVAGMTNSMGGGGYDGLITRMNKRGNTIWSKAFGGSGDDVFYTIKRTTDNGFIAVGQTKSHGNAAGDAWLVKLDASGNLQWSKKYGDGNVNGEIAYDVIQLSDGGFAFSGSHRFTPGNAEGFVTRTDNQGNVLWSKQYGIFGSDQITEQC